VIRTRARGEASCHALATRRRGGAAARGRVAGPRRVPGRNGRIAVAVDVAAGMQIRTSTLGGHRLRVVATVPYDLSSYADEASGWPQWSSDGRRLTFDRSGRGQVVMRADGSPATACSCV
jgi:hypothetical protein